MKKLLFLLSGICLSTGLYAQDPIEIYLYEEDTEVSGTTQYVVSTSASPYLDFDVKNVSGASMNLRIERIKIIEFEGTGDFLCWGANQDDGDCYTQGQVAPYNPYVTPESSIIYNDSSGWLSTHHATNDVAGCAQYRYYIINEFDTKLDSVDVNFCSTVSIEEEERLNIAVYPNPASKFVNIVLEDNGVGNLDFRLYNILGETLVSAKLNQGQNTFNVEDLPEGVYFYTVIRAGKAIETKKLVVKH